jgi:glycosyltransferase involved in cell wall biosynthesis
MKVAYLTRGAFGVLGGASSFMVPTYMSELCKVKVLCPTKYGENEEKIFINNNLDVTNIESVLDEEIIYRVYRELEKFDPDIVHIFQGPLCLRFLHDLKHFFPNARWILDFRSPLLAKAGRYRKKMLWRYFLSQFYADKLLTHSLKTIKNNIALRIRTFTEITFGVELNKFEPKKLLNITPRKFVYIGSLTSSRNLGKLIRAFGEYVADSGEKLYLDIYGEGNDKKMLQDAVNKNNWHSIQIKGSLNHSELIKILPKYDIGIAYVDGDKYSNAPSLKSVEYSAAGLPVLASDTNGHRYWSKKYNFTYNYFANEKEKIQESIKKVSKNESLQNQSTNNLVAVKIFDWSRIAKDQLLPLYKEMVQ